MSDILLVTVCGIADGCDGWSAIELFGQQRLPFLRHYQAFEHGCSVMTPTPFAGFSARLILNNFKPCSSNGCAMLLGLIRHSKHIAIDGKAARGSADSAQNALHLISACY